MKTRTLRYWFSLCLLALAAQMQASPLTSLEKQKDTCKNGEFTAVLSQWTLLSGNYSQAHSWIKQCAQYPESVVPLVRKLKEQIFKFQNPPDIPGYAAAMSESRTRARLERAWTLYDYLTRMDRRAYQPAEKMKLSVIPGILEEIALGKREYSHAGLCRVELDAESILYFSALETSFWKRLNGLRARTDLTSQDRAHLSRIDACLIRQYADPSIGREASMRLSGFLDMAERPSGLSTALAQFASSCEEMAAGAAVLRVNPIVPVRPVDARMLEIGNAIRRDCDDVMLQDSLESMNRVRAIEPLRKSGDCSHPDAPWFCREDHDRR